MPFARKVHAVPRPGTAQFLDARPAPSVRRHAAQHRPRPDHPRREPRPPRAAPGHHAGEGARPALRRRSVRPPGHRRGGRGRREATRDGDRRRHRRRDGQGQLRDLRPEPARRLRAGRVLGRPAAAAVVAGRDRRVPGVLRGLPRQVLEDRRADGHRRLHRPGLYTGQDELRTDIENLHKALAGGSGVTEAFMPSTSPWGFGRNEYYGSEREYYEAVAEALREEYLAIVDAGFLLQIDDPWLIEILADPSWSPPSASAPPASTPRSSTTPCAASRPSVSACTPATGSTTARGSTTSRCPRSRRSCWASRPGPTRSRSPTRDTCTSGRFGPTRSYASASATPCSSRV